MSNRRALEALQRIAQDYCEIYSSHTPDYVFRPASLQAGSAEEALLRGTTVHGPCIGRRRQDRRIDLRQVARLYGRHARYFTDAQSVFSYAVI